MATIRKRERKDGVIYDIQVKIKDSGSGKAIVKTTTWVPDKRMTPKQAEREVAIFAKNYENEMRRIVVESATPVDDQNITVRQFGEEWLTKLKRDHALSYCEKCKEALDDIYKHIGGYSVRKLTPVIIQKYYDNLDSRKKVVQVITAKDDFKERLISYGFNFTRLTKELNIQCNTLCTAYHGGNVSKGWADKLCQNTKLPFDELFIMKMTEEEYAFETIDRYKRVLRAMLSKAKKARLIEDNYASADYIDLPKKPPSKIRCMDEEVARRFFEKLYTYKDLRVRVALMIFILCGFRREEVAGLQWKDINWKEKTISVERAIVYIRGYGLDIKEPKTIRSKRQIAIPQTLYEVLEEYYQCWCNQINKMGDLIPDGTDWLFIQSNGKPLNPHTYLRWLRKLLKMWGLEHYNLLSLRHTNITMQITAGVPIITVSGRVGHSKTSTTVNVYSHFLKSSDQNAAKTIDDLFNSSRSKDDKNNE